MLVDNEIYHLWSKFAKGVRIFVLSDSCHNASVVRTAPWFLEMSAAAARENWGAPKFVPLAVVERAYATAQQTYEAIQKVLASSEDAKIQASVLLLSGCQDNQIFYDGPRNGKFTVELRKAWTHGKFMGGYKTLHSKILAAIEEHQSPNYFEAGAANSAFEKQKPFTIRLGERSRFSSALFTQKQRGESVMNLKQLTDELTKIKNDGDKAIDGAKDLTLLGGTVPGLQAKAGAAAPAVVADKKKESKSWFRKLIDGLLDTVRNAICCHGLTEIDSEEERKAIAEKLLKAILDSIPLPYRLVAKLLLKGLIRKAILKILEYLKGQGDRICDGVSCSLSPLAID